MGALPASESPHASNMHHTQRQEKTIVVLVKKADGNVPYHAGDDNARAVARRNNIASRLDTDARDPAMYVVRTPGATEMIQ